MSKREYWVETGSGDAWREMAGSKAEAWLKARRQVLANPRCHNLAIGWSESVEVTVGEMADDNDYLTGRVHLGEEADGEVWDADAVEDEDGEWPTPVNLSRGAV